MYTVEAIDADFEKQIVERLIQLRNRCGMTKENVAESTRLNVYRYESGKCVPGMRTLVKFCKVYNVTLSEFFAPISY